MKSLNHKIDEELIYKPCKKCGCQNYDQADFDDLEETPDGKFIIHPKSCDKCNLMLMMSDSDLIH